MYQDAPIRNCAAPDGQTGCPQQWGNLKASYVEGVRHCATCNRNVYLCRTEQDVKLYSALNYCFAIGVPVAGQTEVARDSGGSAPQWGDGRIERRAPIRDLPQRFAGRPQPDRPRERRAVRRES